MNIQLFLADQEVELDKNVSFPLNKTFSSLSNPTEIIVEYSKTVSIPATKRNNEIMSNAYRIDRQYVSNNTANNIGLGMDPLKRIPAKLIYNGSIMLDGYAKYTSSSLETTGIFYNFNIYGILGEIFQSLLNCVVDRDRLTEEQKAEEDGGEKYLIKTPWEPVLINKDFVKSSWDNDEPSSSYYWEPFNSIGMAPAYRGLYDDFESNTIKIDSFEAGFDMPTEISVEEKLKRNWKTNLLDSDFMTNLDDVTRVEKIDERVEAIDISSFISNGLSEHNMGQFRAYEQKPYIYIHSLLNIYKNKIKELCDYDLILDNKWFNSSNPYYRKLCYMFDYLSVRGNTLALSMPFTNSTELKFVTQYCTASKTYSITDNKLLSKSDITIDPFTINVQVKDNPPSFVTDPASCQIKMASKSCLTLRVKAVCGSRTQYFYFWGGTGTPSNTANVGPNAGSNYPDEEYIYMSEKTLYYKNRNELIWTGSLNIPSFKITHNPNESVTITYDIQYITGTSMANDRYKWTYYYKSADGQQSMRSLPVTKGVGQPGWDTVANNDNYKFILPNITYNVNWRNNTTCELKNLYCKDEPLFNVILQYTKMFHLLWVPDYINKTIMITPASEYFRNYKILDWNDKILKDKGVTIHPISFNSKFIKYNYEPIDGYRYSGYKNKYGVEYGEKRLKTKYEFDNTTTDLFKNPSHPSSVSCRSFYNINDLSQWDTLSTLPSTPSEINFIDADNDDQSSSIAINNWYFRLDNKETEKEYKIADVSDYELSSGKYFWVSHPLVEQYAVNTQVLPQFSPVIKDKDGRYYGCIYNCPNEDYTNNYQITNAKGNYIYDLIWGDYINEFYNSNNKRIECSIRLSQEEFREFKFTNFVTIENNLFIVNKISDYDINSNIGKCELVQITNIDSLHMNNISFDIYQFSANELYITPKKISGTEWCSGSTSLTIIGEPVINGLDDFSITINPISSASGSECIQEDAEITEEEGISGIELFIYWSGTSIQSEEWEMIVRYDGKTKKIPIYILEN